MKVRFYSFAKRKRSTLQPSGSYVEKDMYLKDGCSMLSPTFECQTFNPSAYNYFYVPDWNRYYFRTDVGFANGMHSISGKVDPLASFKTSIGITRCSILYATGATKDIPDTRIPVLATLLSDVESASLGFTFSYANMRIILGITGRGSFGCYIMDNNNKMSEILDGIDSWSSFITDNWTFTKQLFFGGSAAENLRSAIGIPIAFNKSDHGDLEDLNLGAYPCMDSNDNPIKGYKIFDPILDAGVTVTIPWIYSDWRNIAAYSDVCLYIPAVGLITMPASEVKDELSLSIDYKINITSGDIAGTIKGHTTGKIYSTFSANCAMPIAYGSTGIDTNKVTQAAITGIGTLVAISAATGGAGSIISGALGGELIGNTVIGAGLAATANNIMQALGGKADGQAGLGGGATCALDSNVYCFVKSKQLSESQSNLSPIFGKPFMAVSTPGSFSGYVQTDGFQFSDSSASYEEIEEINNMMDAGIYYE